MAAPRVALAGRSIPTWAKTAGRAVHVKIHPQPRDLGESREILRVLQRYGEVVMYKHLKHEPDSNAANTALAIYQNTDSAEEILNASPLRFGLGNGDASSKPQDSHGSAQRPDVEEGEIKADLAGDQPHLEDSDMKQEWLKSLAKGRSVMREPAAGTTSFTGLSDTVKSWDHQHPQATSIPISKPRIPKPFTPNPTPSSTAPTSLPFPPSRSTSPKSAPTTTKDNGREFHLTITRSVLNHRAYIQRQHYYGGFRLDKMNIMAEDLELRVPVKGMADCQLGKRETSLRMRLKRKEEEEKTNNGRRRTLRQIWEEGRREREDRESKTS